MNMQSDSDHPIYSTQMVGFINHLRLNGFRLGPGDTKTGLQILRSMCPSQHAAAKLGMKVALCGTHDEWDQYDALFEAYWYGRGKVSKRAQLSNTTTSTKSSVSQIWNRNTPADPQRISEASQNQATDDDDQNASDRAIGPSASRQSVLAKTDLRHIVDAQEIAEAEALALKLARAMRVSLSRRHKSVAHGNRLDLRRTIRRSLSYGGEPVDLIKRIRPHRPARIIILLDVSGSMKAYSRFFLQFVKGVVGQWVEAEAFVFHTRLIKVSDAMRVRDALRSITQLSLMVEGFGGGTKIGTSLRTFNMNHAKKVLNSRSVVILLSDGYDTGEPEVLVAELKRLKRKARRIVWLNPLLGWENYRPVSQAMSAVLPLIDCFHPASTLEQLAAIEPEISRL